MLLRELPPFLYAMPRSALACNRNIRFGVAMSNSLETPMQKALFQGTKQGPLKSLNGYQKGYSLPDSPGEYADRTTRRLGAGELEEHGETLFQNLKKTFGFKRRELSLDQDTDAGAASIQAAGFRVDIELRGDPEQGDRYHLVTEVGEITDPDLARSEAFATVFDGLFDRLIFEFAAPADVEDVIDRIEDLENDTISVSYPSDASECTVAIAGHATKLHFRAERLTLMAPHATDVASLIEASEQVPTMFG